MDDLIFLKLKKGNQIKGTLFSILAFENVRIRNIYMNIHHFENIKN